MAHEFYVAFDFTTQGKSKGESPRKEHNQKIAGLEFEYELIAPRDVATGQASGKRQHKPVRLVKEWGAASPQLFQACATNETIKSVLFEFIKSGSDGKEVVYQTIKLTNATVSRLRQYTEQNAKHEESADTHELEEVELTFQKIEMENKPGKTSAADDWNA
ncbi:MAG TPA: type VI secretion system tube protein TssD [Gemmataceae bacterium]|jgi:type VI secretion system secreted protein Hcp|nr:type VI secretion system tube protein TssD [Gemmataceae bacterium]